MDNVSHLLSAEPARLHLANLPTPLQKLRFSAGGSQFWIKRDDFTGCELSGNKVRKLEYLVAQAQSQNATVLITCGGEQSNHARATAIVAAQLGLKCHLVLRTVDPSSPPAPAANLLMNCLVGAEISWISHVQWRQRDVHMASVASRWSSQGERPFVIPVGGSNAMGCWGYIRGMHELVDDVQRAGLLADFPSAARPLTIAYACGSGGTAAGMIIAAKILKLRERGVHLVAINVSDDRAYFVAEILRICAEFTEQFDVGVTVTADDIDICDGYVGAGYAKSQPDELARIRQLARTDGVILDPVYTGKAFHGIASELERDQDRQLCSFTLAGSSVLLPLNCSQLR
jgi:D-cysteine desulfhydrase